jgi:hypothetical protein
MKLEYAGSPMETGAIAFVDANVPAPPVQLLLPGWLPSQTL